MSAAPSLAFEDKQQRVFPRHPINVPLDLIALRSGVPENLPGRCTDISEAGVGAVIAGELTAGQQVAVELRLPDFGLPLRARALVRYQSRLRCGLEFSGLSAEQREMIRYWVQRSAPGSTDFRRDFGGTTDGVKIDEAEPEAPAAPVTPPAKRPRRTVRVGRRAFYVLFASMIVLAILAWWQWQRSWNELEKSAPISNSELRVSPETMEKMLLTKVEPLYPEAAREASTEGLVVLEAVIAPDGSVERLRPLSGPNLLVQSAAQAVHSWKFEPYLSSGKPVAVETTIAIEFRMN